VKLTRQALKLALGIWVLSAVAAVADVKLPALFADHMILQRGKDVAVWGRAEIGEKVTVSIAGKSANATADAAGNWQLALPPLPEGAPLTMAVK